MSRIRRGQPFVITFWLLSCAMMLSACGGCPKAQRAWNRAASIPAKSKEGPHWMLEVKTSEVRERLSRSKSRGKFEKSRLKIKSPIPRVDLASIKFELSDFKWVINGDQGILKVTIAALIKQQEILKLKLSGESPLKLDLKARKIKLQVRADQFKRASLRLGDGAEKALRRAIRKQIPRELRGLLPKKRLLRFVKKTLKVISDEGYPIIRKNILSPLGEVAKLEWALPDYPITKMEVKVSDEAWRIGLWTNIKADGLGAKAMSLGVDQEGRGARLVISAPWLAAAGNWAMKKGKLPSRFNRKGEPTSNGSAVATMTWNSKKRVKRPLKIHLWAGEQKALNLCLYARAGVDPDLKVKAGKLSIKTESKLERVEGSKLAKMAVNLSGIGERTLKWHHEAASLSSMKVGGSSMPLTWLDVALNRDYLSVGLDLSDHSAQSSLDKSSKGLLMASTGSRDSL